MNKNKVCWKVTTKCNQGCKYCYGFTNINDLDFESNKKVLNNLIEGGLTHITWTGGEALLYPYFREMVKYSKEKGIHNKLVTNGIFLSQTDDIDSYIENLESITLSIDSIHNEINAALGKADNHLNIIKRVLDRTKNKDIKININTVVSSKSINGLNELGDFLNQYKIDTWKFLKFMPFREKAAENKDMFGVEESDLLNQVNNLRKFENINKAYYKKQSELEKSIVVLPNGKIIRTDNGKDLDLGDALNEKVRIFENSNIVKKIKTFVLHSNEEIRNSIVNTINSLGYVDIVGTASENNEAYEKIVTLKPDMVFATYNLDLIKKTKETLQESFPSFNTIGEIPDEELIETVKITGSKLNASVTELNEVKDIMEAYREYKL